MEDSKTINMYVNEDSNGWIYISKKPMNQTYYSTPAILKCIETTNKKITRKDIFPGCICETINGQILKIIKVKFRKGFERSYIKEGTI